MKLKPFKILILALLLSVVCIVFFTHIFTLHLLTGSSMLPTYREGSMVAVSRLKEPLYGDMVCFVDPSKPGGDELMLRIAGLPGDTIEMNDGYALRNGFIADRTDRLMFNYVIKRSKVRDWDMFNKLMVKPNVMGDTVILSLSSTEAKEYGRYFVLHKMNKPKTQKEPGIFRSNPENCWNASNYGPIAIPRGYCFLLADNRDNSPDSRHFGFVPLEDIRGTVMMFGKEEVVSSK